MRMLRLQQRQAAEQSKSLFLEKKEITKVKLSEEVVDPDDIEMLEDLIMAATNEALRQIDEQSQASMSKITGGLGGGLF